MAKKSKSKKGYTEPQGFTHGMISDVDPHFQLKGSYSDAQNIRLTNSEGNTFTIENIEGNSLFVDLASEEWWKEPSYENNNGTYIGDYQNQDKYHLHDKGPNIAGSPLWSDNLNLANRCSIVGHVSYAQEMLLILVARYDYMRNDSADVTDITEETHNRTIFLKVRFDNDAKIASTGVIDLSVCTATENSNYPDLNMDLDTPIRIEKIIENGCISRIYWTDNKNPLRTLNLNQKGKNQLSIQSLDITPLMEPSQPVLDLTLTGSLPVGVYQYTYKYISENGGETTFSPLSNVYHVSDQAFGSSVSYGGGPKGNLGTQGFSIKVSDIDDNFDYIELYSLLYEDLNTAPRVSLVGRNAMSGGSGASEFQHLAWNNELENGLEEVLIDTNTWDVCKDIAIKDNILFAANLKQKRNWISEKEWNVKVLRWRIAPGGGALDAMLTTTDTNVKHYYKRDALGIPFTEVTDGTQDVNTDLCGHGKLLTEFSDGASGHINYDGTKNNPMWTTCLENQRNGDISSSNNLDPKVKTKFEYRYLSDRMTCGAESFNYTENDLGGCRVSFRITKKEADQTQNTSSSPYISATNGGATLKTDEIYDILGDGVYSFTDNTETVFKTSMSLGGSRDPHMAGDRRGYQRGEIYRFGVQVYDKNGVGANVLWIGDIQMPEQYDPLRLLKYWATDYTPFRPTYHGPSSSGVNSLVDFKQICSSVYSQDHRLSYIYGHVIPPIDVEWFTNRQGNGVTNTDAYVDKNGDLQQWLPGVSQSFSPNGRVKGRTNWHPNAKMNIINDFDNIHYLFDLALSFEFLIPNEVCKKISGFRVVRAERKEDDKRIVQQGLLNQTKQYGNASLGLEAGYGVTNFSNADNKGFGDDPIFVNQYNETTPTKVEQPEYNTYLNGYLGLAENSNLAGYESGYSDGKVTSGGNTNNEIYAWPEREDSKKFGDRAGYPIPNTHSTGSHDYKWIGPGSVTTLHKHTSYFGSYDKRETYQDATDPDPGSPIVRWQGNLNVSGSIFTLDSPDSAFGTRPYVFRDGDHLRIDSVLKISHDKRFKKGTSTWMSGYPGYFYTHCAQYSDMTGSEISTPISPNDASEKLWKAVYKNQSDIESLRFAKKRHLDTDYSILVAKYYCFDPYYGIGMEIDGGVYAGVGYREQVGHSERYVPGAAHGYTLPLSAGKEISDGEIVPNGFFKKSYHVEKGLVQGFSNNTLGFTRTHLDWQDKRRWHSVFDAVHSSISKLDGDGTDPWGEVKEEDYTYDTISTMQMGLRSILLEVNTKVSEVKKHGPGGNDTNWEYRADKLNTRYDNWFACPDLSSIYEQGDWYGHYKNGGYIDAANTFNLKMDSPLSRASVSGRFEGWDYNTRDQNLEGTTTGNDTLKGRDLHPHKFLCSIVRRVIPYGGWTKNAIEKTRYIPCGNFHPIKEPPSGWGNMQGHLSKVAGGDTFVNLYSHQKTATPYMKKSAARWQIFPVESYVNTDMRSGLTLNNGDTTIGKEMNQEPFSNDWLYNNVYSQENSIKSALMIDEEETCESLDLPFEIAYSNTKVSGEPGDAFRSFPINQFHDMEGLYGEINRIVNFKNEIYVIQDSAFAKLLVNPLSMLSDDAGTSLFTGTGETVENHIYISTKYGSRQRFSIAMSEKSLYFVDTNYARLFKYDTEQLTSLGDALGQRNYFKNIIGEWEQAPRMKDSGSWHPTLRGRLDSAYKPTWSRNYAADNPLKFLGVTSVFDYKNKELLVTIHNSHWNSLETSKDLSFADPYNNDDMGSTIGGQPVKISETIVYNESINAFVSKYSVAPPQWLTGAEGAFIFCPENELSVWSLSNLSWSESGTYDIGYAPYYQYGSVNGGLDGATSGKWYKNYRPNPLRLWLWDKHYYGLKTNFFGKADDVLTAPTEDSVVDDTFSGKSHMTVETNYKGIKYIADESYIEKVINTEAGERKVFDNVSIIMTPGSIPVANNLGYSFADFKTEITDYQHAVLKQKWYFNNGADGWSFEDDGELEEYGAPTSGLFTTVILGCMNSNATNYNSNATIDDVSCIYGPLVYGCTNSSAINYYSNANVNDGSCNFTIVMNGCTDQSAVNYDSTANTDDGTCTYPVYGCTDSTALNYDTTTIPTHDDGSCAYPPVLSGCMDSTATNYNSSYTVDDGGCIYLGHGCTDPNALNYDGSANTNDGSCVYPILGCTDSLALNYDTSITANTDDGTCCYLAGCTDPIAENYDNLPCEDDGSCIYIYGCMNSTMFPYDPLATVDDGSCVAIVYGCIDSDSVNYSPSANTDDGSCIPCIYGCMDSTTCNYDAAATCDDGTCFGILGCTDSTSCNYNALATCDDSSCYGIAGCTNSTSCNYDATATCDDGSCYGLWGCTYPTACNYNPLATCQDGSCAGGGTAGCTDPNACNYDPLAACDNGLCTGLAGCTDPTFCNYNALATCDNGSCAGTLGCNDANACNYDASAGCDDGSCIFPTGCGDPLYLEYDAVHVGCSDPALCITLIVNGCTDPTANNHDTSANVDDGSCLYPTGCTDSTACNYDGSAIIDDGSCHFLFGCIDPSACNYDPFAMCLGDGTNGPLCIGIGTAGCTDSTACNYDATALCDNGTCGGTIGCTDSNYVEYNPLATCDPLTDQCITTSVFGCTDPAAFNYNSSANTDDGNCIPCVDGCTDPTQFNYDPNATCDDGSCIPIVSGCTDSTPGNHADINGNCANSSPGAGLECDTPGDGYLAENFNPAANTDDGSCTYDITPGVSAFHVFLGYFTGSVTSCSAAIAFSYPYNGGIYGSHYDAVGIEAGGSFVNATWDFNGTTYNEQMKVVSWRDLNTGYNVVYSRLDEYMTNTGWYAGHAIGPQPTPDWGINRCYLYDAVVTSAAFQGPCTYMEGVDFLRNDHFVYFDPPTNPYNL